jgi:hypothetical protein
MSSFAAILVLVACPVNSAHCLANPVRIATYEQARDCEVSMLAEIRRMHIEGMRILGSCNTFDARLMSKMQPIDMTASIDPASVMKSGTQATGSATGFLETRR